MNLFRIIITFYLLYALTVTLHELFHYITGKIIGLKNLEIYIGESFFRINIKKVHFSPLITNGYVEFDYIECSKKKIIFFYLSGSLANLLLILVGLLFKNNYGYILCFMNLFIILFNLIPIRGIKNDIAELKQYINNM